MIINSYSKELCMCDACDKIIPDTFVPGKGILDIYGVFHVDCLAKLRQDKREKLKNNKKFQQMDYIAAAAMFIAVTLYAIFLANHCKILS